MQCRTDTYMQTNTVRHNSHITPHTDVPGHHTSLGYALMRNVIKKINNTQNNWMAPMYLILIMNTAVQSIAA